MADQHSNPSINTLTSLLKKAAPVIIIAAALAARALPGLRTIDDAHITFRYARNILAGRGFVYNPGEAIQGTTTPLYTLLLTLVGLTTGGSEAPFPTLAVIINSLADALTCWLLIKIGRRLEHPLAGLAAGLIWAVAPFSVTFAIGGMETSVFLLLLTSAVYFYLQGAYRAASAVSAFSIITRPDGILLVGLLILDRARAYLGSQRKDKTSINFRQVLVEAGIFLIPLTLWFGFAWHHFGSPIPHSVTAKIEAYHLAPRSALVRLLQHYATPFLGHHTLGTSWIKVGLILYPFLFLIGSRRAVRAAPALWPWALYPWVYFLAFSAANPLIFRWYLTPPLLPYLFFILIGLEDLTRKLLETGFPFRVRHKGEVITILLILLLPLAFNLHGWELTPDHGPSRPAPKMAWHQLELLYRDAAELVQEDLDQERAAAAQANAVLAAGDVGVLGYYTDLRILDTVGLNSPQPLKYYPLPEEYYVINYAVPPGLILDQRPDYLVILEIYGRKSLFPNQAFQKQYHLLATIPTEIYSSRGLLIFKLTEQFNTGSS